MTKNKKAPYTKRDFEKTNKIWKIKAFVGKEIYGIIDKLKFLKISAFFSQYRYHLIIVFLVPLAILTYLTYNGLIFEKKVEYTSFAIGNFKYPVLIPNGSRIDIDYKLLVRYESKGAFIAGREIHVSVDLILQHDFEKFNKSKYKLGFPHAFSFPMSEEDNERNPDIIYLDTNFINASIAHGEMDIIYLTHEYFSDNEPFKFYNPSTNFNYVLFVDDAPQFPGYIEGSNLNLYLAPLETELQLKNNRLTLILTYFVLYLTIVQILISLPKGND